MGEVNEIDFPSIDSEYDVFEKINDDLNCLSESMIVGFDRSRGSDKAKVVGI